MALLYDDPRFLQHETGNHPERAERIRLIPRKLEETGLSERCCRPPFRQASRSRVARIHSTAYMDEIWAFSKSGGGYLEIDTVVSPESYQVALTAAGAVSDAVERVVRGEDLQALCVVRPPGHHALFSRCMGFCLFNNVAIGAKVATDELGLDSVLIVDWDVHHGNGTQAAFWEDPKVGFLSIHRWPFYPGSGDEEETGGGRGLGTIVNLPVEFGISRKDYIDVFRVALERLAAKMRPQLVMISAGFDTHAKDPIGNLGLQTEDFATLTNAVQEVADVHAGGRVVSVLEGGYDPEVTADCVAVHFRELAERSEAAANQPKGEDTEN
jgi:acetoin utilization deacetylase AcuC-like enzyme